MITLVEALNYRCLRYAQRPLQRFHVLVGPNASGKTTFLDVMGFLRDLVSDGLDAAVSKRAENPRELLFRGRGGKLELAVEALIPDELRKLTAKPELSTARYEVSVGFDETRRRFEFKDERLLLRKPDVFERQERALFPMPPTVPETLLIGKHRKDARTVINKVWGGNDNFYRETGKGWAPSFKLGPRKSALGNLPADVESFPAAAWFRECLTAGVRTFLFNSLAIKQPSAPTQAADFLPDGSNLPWAPLVCGSRTRKDIEHGSHTCGRSCPIWRTSPSSSARRTSVATWSMSTRAG